MARIAQITLKQLPSYHSLAIRKTIDFMKEFSDFTGYAFDKIAEYLKSIGEIPSGAPIVCFHNMNLENLDLEVGFPVAYPIDGKDDITANIIPTQKIASTIDLGAYEKQDPTLEELFAWIQSNGYEMQGEIYYQYLNDTERPDSDLLTMMFVPVK